MTVTQKSTFHLPLSVGSQCESGTGIPYLVLDRCTNGLRIRTSAKHGRKLNRFWTVWARELVQKLDSKYQLKIVIRGKTVRVTSPEPVETWGWAVYCVVANVVPLPDPPIVRNRDNGRGIRWNVTHDANLRAVVSAIELPAAAHGDFWLYDGWQQIYLVESGVGHRKRTITLSELGMMVELKIALACRRRYETWED